MLAAIGGSVCVVLFVPGFWEYSLTGNTDGVVSASGNGFDIIRHFLENISTHEWGWSTQNSILYAMVLFLIFSAVDVIILVFAFIFNFGNLNRSKKLLRSSSAFMTAATILTTAYVYMVFDSISVARNAGIDTSWGVRTFPIFFYIPILSALIMSVLAAVFRSSEK